MSLLDTATDNVAKVADKALGEAPMLNLIDSANNRLVDSMKSLPGARDLQALGFPMVDELFQTDMSQGPVVRDHRQEQQYGSRGGYDQGNVRDHTDEWSDSNTSYNGPEVRDHRQESQGYDWNYNRDEWSDHERHNRPDVRDHRHGSGYDSHHDHVRDHRQDSCHDSYRNWDFNDCLCEMFGRDRNPYDDMLGGRDAFEQGMRFAMSLLARNPENLLKELFGRGRDSGGGGLFGKVFSGITGLLGGGGGGGLGGLLGGILGGGGGGGLGGILGGILGGGSEGGGGGLLGSLLPVALKVAPLLL
jgi:hypothetical protein